VLDYSSLRFDYALTEKPMLFFVPDLETYRAQSRGFLFDYEPTAPGPLLQTLPELVAAIHGLQRITAEHPPAYRAFNDRFNQNQDGHAAARVVDAFFGTAAAPTRVDPPRAGREV
jgi:CDP-glycerol glycerophosphotransferase